MRRDFILPAVLGVALVIMGVYAATAEGEKDTDSAPLTLATDTAPIQCGNGQLISRIGRLPEASGLALSSQSPHLFWSHNDSNDPMIYAVGADGSVRGAVRATGADAVDWEAITTGVCANGNCLFIGDIGDNDARRSAISVYRTREPSPTDRATTPVERLDARYPEGPQDAEALFVADGSLFVVTKGEKGPVRIYKFPQSAHSAGGGPASAVTLELIATLTDADPKKKARVTDAAVSPNGRWLALRTNDVLLFYEVRQVLSGKPGTALMYPLAELKEPQGEGVAWADDRTLYLAGEREGGGTFGRITCALPAAAD